MKNYQKCSLRDNAILSTIEKLEVLNSEQIRLLFFSNLSQNKLVCQRRLKALYDSKRVKRCRYNGNEPYFYYIDKKPKQIEHKLGVNWVYVWQTLKYRQLPDYKVTYWQSEDTYETLRADAFMVVENTFKKIRLMYFVEFDIAESGNTFDKIELYNDLYQKNEIKERKWYRFATGFPTIIIVTTGGRERVEKHLGGNRHGLDFQIKTLEEVKGECFKWML